MTSLIVCLWHGWGDHWSSECSTQRDSDPRQTADSAPSRADKIAAAIVPDQLDQYLGAGECDLHDVCRDGKRQCPYHQALAAGPSCPPAFPSDSE